MENSNNTSVADVAADNFTIPMQMLHGDFCLYAFLQNMLIGGELG
jgi:hypothetical protein